MFKCINPSHQDKSPSMGMNLDNGSFNCFGCKTSGSFSDFKKLILGDSEYFFNTKPSTVPRVRHERKKIVDPEIVVTGKLVDIRDYPNIRNWATLYGILDDEFIDKYGVKYSFYSEAIAKHLIGSDIEKLKGWTSLSNRLITPIYKKGKIVNIEARTTLSKEQLPQGMRKVLYILGGSASYIWGYDHIDPDKPMVLTEGIKGASMVWNVNQNVGALMHAIPSNAQIDLLKNVRSDIIVFANADTAGLGKYDEKGEVLLKGTVQVLEEKLGRDFKVCFDKRTFPDGKEYDESDCTLDEIDNHLTKARWYSEYKDELKNKDIKKIVVTKNLKIKKVIKKEVAPDANISKNFMVPLPKIKK